MFWTDQFEFSKLDIWPQSIKKPLASISKIPTFHFSSIDVKLSQS